MVIVPKRKIYHLKSHKSSEIWFRWPPFRGNLDFWHTSKGDKFQSTGGRKHRFFSDRPVDNNERLRRTGKWWMCPNGGRSLLTTLFRSKCSPVSSFSPLNPPLRLWIASDLLPLYSINSHSGCQTRRATLRQQLGKYFVLREYRQSPIKDHF